MMAALYMQKGFGPQPEDGLANANDNVAAVDGDDQNADADPKAVVQDRPEPPAGETGSVEPPTDKPAVDAEAKPQSEAGENQEEGQAANPVANPVAKPAIDDDFVKLGSLNEDGSDRYLVTINRKGGTVHRVELNARNTKGKFLYRDIVTQGGYLGSPNLLTNAKQQHVVNAVGRGTPAALAGLKEGDILKTLATSEGGPEPILTVDQIDTWLEKNTKPGDVVSIGIERNGTPVSISATLVHKPISIIAPEGDLVDPNFDYPESFVLSLLKPQTYYDRAWPDVAPGMRTNLWEVTDASTDDLIELKYDIPADMLKQMELPGPITVFKRYRLPQADDANDARSFHLGFEIEIQNGADTDLALSYELDGPTGTSAETWWYANKIHGRQMAIGYVAGARDVVASTGVNSYLFLGCPEIVKGASYDVPETPYICDPNPALDPKNRQLKYAGVDSHYFNVSVLPETDDGFLVVNSATAFPNNDRGRIPKIPSNSRLKNLVDCTFQMVVPAKVPAKGSFKQSFEIFCGPKDPDVLSQYGLGDVRTFGWFSWCSYVLLAILHFLYWITFQTSYGLAIILLTVLVRCIMIPFSRKAALNAQMMQHLAPQIKEISDKYKDNMEKRAEAQKELYKKYNFNPLGGCFMMFFQLPIFYGLYKGLNVDIALRDQPLIPGIQWCSNLAAPDQFLYWKDWMPGWLADETGYLGPYLNILPLVTMALFIIQQKLFTPPPTDDQQKFMQKMMTFMMLFLGLMFFKVPAGLCIYFITSSLWGIVERQLLPKPVLNVEKFGDTATPKSAKEQRAEDRAEAERQAEIEARKKKNLERKKKLKNRGM